MAILLIGCNDSFMERYPTDNLNNVTYWKTKENLETYNNGIYNQAASNDYEFYTGYALSGYDALLYATYNREVQSDNATAAKSEQKTFADIAAGLEKIPTDGSYGNRWSWQAWSFLRRCNVFLENYHKADISTVLKQNYAGEAYFWRAWFYLDRVQWLGDVPFINRELNVDSPELYEPKTAHTIVMDSVLNDITRASQWLPETWDKGANTINRITKWAALALKTRICLYEGTYRKYHGLSDANKYLQEAVAAAEEIMASNKFSIYSTGDKSRDLWTLFNSDDLTQNPEVILPYVYQVPTRAHGKSRSIAESTYGLTQDFVDDFLSIEADGTAKPITLSAIYDDTKFEYVFNNRDPRLTQTVLDPRQEVKWLGSNTGLYPSIANIGPSSWKSMTGYHFIKFYDWTKKEIAQNNEESDYPIIRYAEVLLNYAEAKAEMGTMTQNDINISINKIRDRVKMPHLTLNPPMDPKYADLGISSLLVEIRRERRIELACENFRYQDLMRWKQGKRLAQRYLGARVEDADIATGGRFAGLEVARYTNPVTGKKYIDAYAGTNYAADRRSFEENKHYWHPIPINVITKNPQIIQNPNWK